MRRFLLIAVAVLVSFQGAVTLRAGTGKPSGLMTDLVEHTETVWSGGYATDLTLSDLDKAIDLAYNKGRTRKYI